MTGKTTDYNSHCKHEFHAYVQTYKATDNSMRPQTIGAIVLRPTGNEQGGHYYMSFESGRCINCLCATELPMPNDVMTRVHVLARRNPRGLIFRDRNNVIIDDNDESDDNDSTYTLLINKDLYSNNLPTTTDTNDSN